MLGDFASVGYGTIIACWLGLFRSRHQNDLWDIVENRKTLGVLKVSRNTVDIPLGFMTMALERYLVTRTKTASRAEFKMDELDGQDPNKNPRSDDTTLTVVPRVVPGRYHSGQSTPTNTIAPALRCFGNIPYSIHLRRKLLGTLGNRTHNSLLVQQMNN